MQLDTHLHIVAGYKNDRSFLKIAYKQPFKLANITEDKSDACAVNDHKFFARRA